MSSKRPFSGSVAFFSPAWPPEAVANGVVSYVDVMRAALADAGVRSIVVTKDLCLDSSDPDVFVVEPEYTPPLRARRLVDRFSGLGGAFQMGPALARALCPLLARLEQEADLRVLEMEESFGWAGAVAASSPVPVIVRLHGPWFLNGAAQGVARDRRFHARDRLERHALQSASAVTAPSRDVLERSRRHFGLSLPDAEVIPNPIRPVPFEDCWTPSKAEPGHVVFVGRFDRHKGGDTLVDAFRSVLDRVPEARLSFAGRDVGLVDDVGVRWNFDTFVRARFRNTAAIQALGPCTPLAIQSLRARAAVVVVASRYETFSYTALEAMAMGCPLVATRAGALTEVLRDGENALTCDPADPEALAGAIVRLLEDPGLAARLARRARLDCMAQYHPSSIASRTLALYERHTS